MNSKNYFLTDVFAISKYTGNQLATFMNGQHFTTEEMQNIAREINFSETTFIISEDSQNSTYRVRIFTPLEEVDFAGHPTLGTAYLIREFLQQNPSDLLTIEVNAGKVIVEFIDELVWMSQLPPVFGNMFDKHWLAEILSLSSKDISDDSPIQEVSTGLPVTIVPLTNLDALCRAKINKRLYNEFEKQVEGRGIFIYSKEGYSQDFDISARFFADCYGIPEDPATGSANGCLAAYLLKYDADGKNEIHKMVGQGFEINRPSKLYIQSYHASGVINVRVGGKVVPIAGGSWLI